MISLRGIIVGTGVAVAVLLLGAPGPLGAGACTNDIKSLCAGIEPGGGRMRDCIREHRASLSAACKAEITDRMLERAGHRGGAGNAAIRTVPENDGAAKSAPAAAN
jgi:hypothetical protein